jgi:mRNA-degrading endonuclease toxin of MazEF toxin-antitoxin module
MKYRQGDVVLVKVIFSEGSGVKKRPALIVSDKYYHNHRQEVIISAITSNIDRLLSGDTKIQDWQKIGLKYPSLVTGIIQTIKTKMVERKLGKLSERDFLETQINLKKSLGFLG